jgi:menaquinone-specific isochorismate synthase
VYADQEHDVALYWQDPKDRTQYVAIDVAYQFEATSEHPIDELQSCYAKITKHIMAKRREEVRFFLALAFDPSHRDVDQVWHHWPNGWLYLPQYVFSRRTTGETQCAFQAWFTPENLEEVDIEQIAQRILDQFRSFEKALEKSVIMPIDKLTSSRSSDSREQYEQLVGSAIQELSKTALKKVVLARRETLIVEDACLTKQAVQTLSQTQLQSAVFAIKRHEETFLGATPERLVTVQEGEVFVDCLAGTTSRSRDEGKDRQLADALLHSTKNREEHAHVVTGVRDALADITTALTIPEEPRIRSLRFLQHLYTPVRGTLAKDVLAFDVVARLHPTPAIAGLPKELAMTYLREAEGMDRGWYAAPIGWIDGAGNLDAYVGLRSALIRDKIAHLFAGAGITQDSLPTEEGQETELKLLPMLDALRAIAKERAE